MSSQEATIICADNSEWMRNGDYLPNRLEAEKDAIRMVANFKTNINVESTVGLITMAGRSPEVLVTLTPDIGKILTAVHSIALGDKCDILAALRIAQLALKHRQNKDQRQRIVLFVGSPIECDKKKLTQLGTWLKKNNVAVDIVNFGQLLENSTLLDDFWKAVNNNDNSHLVVIPPGPHALSDALGASPIVDGAAEVLGVGGGFENDADESVRMAIEMSIIDEQQRLARAAQAAGGSSSDSTPSSSTTPVSNSQPNATETTSLVVAPPPAGGGGGMDVDDEDLLAALELSRQTPAAAADDIAETAAMLDDDVDEVSTSYDNLTEEEQMRLAFEMSMQTAHDEGVKSTSTPTPTTAPTTEVPSTPQVAVVNSSSETPTTPAATTTPIATPGAPIKKDDKPDYSAELSNPEVLNSLFQDLPGVDFSSPAIQGILSAIAPSTSDNTKPKDNNDKDSTDKDK